MARKFKNKTLPRGIRIDRGYVFIRIFPNGQPFLKCVGPVSQPGVIDDAIVKLNQYREQIRLGKLNLNERVQRITMEQAVDLYWQWHGSQKKSAKSYVLSLRYLKEFFKGRYVDTITYVDVQRYRHEREKHVQPNSVNKEHTVLTHLFNKLKEWRRLKVIGNIQLPTENPGPLVRKASEKAFGRTRVLSLEEFDRFMRSATMSLRRICLGAIHTTLRLKDLRQLTKANVNQATNQLEGIQAKTGKPYAVPINRVMCQLIETTKGDHIFEFTNFRKQFDETRAEVGLKDFQFRDLRRTGARMMLKKGVDLATVSAYLGHSSLQMTEVYVTPSRDDKRVGGEILGTTYRWDGDQEWRKNWRKVSLNKTLEDPKSVTKNESTVKSNSALDAPVAQLDRATPS
ncbi:MAG: site-specific integrase [Elusimicrobia bacterium]|nr:site-specific integrase [Elusimicrobiota bacterium]